MKDNRAPRRFQALTSVSDNPKHGRFMQMIMKEAEDVEIMIQKLQGSKTRVSEISV